jgi:hypothetical protein
VRLRDLSGLIWYRDMLKRSTKPMRRSPMKRGGSIKSRSRLKPGKKVRQWEVARALLKIAFERVGITACEFGMPGCWGRSSGSEYLSFAHAKKRRNWQEGDIWRVGLACMPVCHHELDEVMRAPEMEREVERIIAARPLGVNEAIAACLNELNAYERVVNA